MPDNPQSESPKPSRRSFLLTTGSTAVAGVVGAYLPVGANIPVERNDSSAGVTSEANVEGTVPIVLRINGKDRQLRVDPRTTLLDCLRETVVLTGTKKGCDHGQCGACTVHVNGRRVLSCLNFAVMHDGEEVTTSGQIMSAVALLKEPCGPDDAAVKELMSGNICRCGAYANIVAAIQQVRQRA